MRKFIFFLALATISCLMLVCVFKLQKNLSTYLNSTEDAYKTSSAVNLDSSLSVDNLSQLLDKYGYVKDKDECGFVAGFIVDSILKKRASIPNLGELNLYKNFIPVNLIDTNSDKCPGLTSRASLSKQQLGIDDEAKRYYNSHETFKNNGHGDVTITVMVENADDEQERMDSVLVRLRKHEIDSSDKDKEIVTVVAHQWTDSVGKAEFKVNEDSFYSVIPIKSGFEYGGPQGSRNHKGFNNKKKLTFKQKIHKIKIFESQTYRYIKEDNTITVRTPDEFKQSLFLNVVLMLICWWLAFFFLCFLDWYKGQHQKRLGMPNKGYSFDYWLFLILMTLNCICVLVMYSIADPLKDKLMGSKMALGSAIGVTFLCLFALINYFNFYNNKIKFLHFDFILQPFHCLGKMCKKVRFLKKIPNGTGYLILAMVLVILLWLFGTSPEGSDAKVNFWIFQPSELSKFLIMVFIGVFFSNNAAKIQDFSKDIVYSTHHFRTVVFVVIAIIGIVLMYLLMVSDMGPALVILVTFILIYSVARRDFVQLVIGVATYLAMAFIGRYLASLIEIPILSIIIEVLFPLLWFGLWIIFIRKRKKIYESAVFFNLLIFLFSYGDDILFPISHTASQRLSNRLAMSGSGVWDNTVYGGDQVAQGIWGLTSGGPYGLGLGHGNANFIPAFHTDMVFESIGEVMGFFTLLLIIICFAILVWRSLWLARRAAHSFFFFTISSIALATGVQFMVIVLGSTGIIPLTGVSVPFLSYGMSGLIFNLAFFGMVLSMSRYRPTRLQEEAVQSYNKVLKVGLTCFGGMSLLVIGMLINYQIINRDEYLVKPVATADLKGERWFEYNPRIDLLQRKMYLGNIYDRDGLLLATSNPEDLRRQMNRLVDAGLERDALMDKLEQKTPRYYPFDNHLLFMLGDYNTRLLWGSGDRYNNPYGYLAEERHLSELRGYDNVVIDTVTLYGDFKRSRFLPSEKRVYTLKRRNYGQPILLEGLKNADNESFIKEWNKKVGERSIRLTIDAVLQKRMQDQLEEWMAKRKDETKGSIFYQRASVVMLDAYNGELLCSANYPLPDQETLMSLNGSNYRETKGIKAISDRDLGLTFQSPPGSTAKVLSSMAAFMEFKDSAENISIKIYENEKIFGHDKPGDFSIKKALMESNNPFFVKLVNRDGTLYDSLAKIYYQTGIRVDLDNYNTNNTPYFLFQDLPATKWSDFLWAMEITKEKAKQAYHNHIEKQINKGQKPTMNVTECAMAWGQGKMMATPLNMARAYSIIANDGLFFPTVYTITENCKQDNIRILDKQYAEKMFEYVNFTAREANKFNDSLIGGKTGTAERKFPLFNTEKNDAWYVAIIKGKKTLAVAVRIERTSRMSDLAVQLMKEEVLPLLKDMGYCDIKYKN